MLYENEICPGCNQPIAQGDDVVVCPDCGTPQHRACWQKDNCCVNSQLHAQGYEWSPAQPAPNDAHANEQPHEEESGEMTCPFCGAVNPADALHCKECGAPFAMQSIPPFGRPAVDMPDIGMDASEPIGDATAGSVASYVGAGAHRYLRKFKRFSDKSGNGASWNWAAFIFAPFWFFYRKLNRVGVLATAVLITITLVSSPYINSYLSDLSEVYKPYIEKIDNGTITDEEIAVISGKIIPVSREHAPELGAMVAADLIFRIACGLLANKAYYKKVLEDLRLIKEAAGDEAMLRYLTARRGGTSFFNLLAGYFGYNMVITLITYLVN